MQYRLRGDGSKASQARVRSRAALVRVNALLRDVAKGALAKGLRAEATELAELAREVEHARQQLLAR